MTDYLGDALNSSAPVWHPVEVLADWQELLPGYVDQVDSLKDLGSQIGPDGWSVSQSFDDGLPDSVTATMQNDAGGSLTADLVGRPPNVADTWGNRTPASATGTGTSVTIPNLTDVAFADTELVVIALNSSTAVVTDANEDPFWRFGWKLLGTAMDGNLKLWLWARKHYSSAPALMLNISVSASYTWVSVAAWARTAAGSIVLVEPGTLTTFAQPGTNTVHSLPPLNLAGRGWTFGFWGRIISTQTFTPAGTDVELIENSATVNLMASRSLFQDAADPAIAMTANTSTTTTTVAAIGVPMRLKDRAAMDPQAYFSPFNADSPIQDFARDTAPVSATVRAITADGIYGEQIFQGRMADLQVRGRKGRMEALSRTRVDVDRARKLPTIFGRREGCTTDWLASYVMAYGGQYAGFAPTANTRFWMPGHGSIHPFMDGLHSYSNGYYYDSSITPHGAWGLRYPESVDGPCLSGMYAQRQNDLVYDIGVRADTVNPAVEAPGIAEALNYDILSQANSIGRLTFWLRGDATTASPAALSGITGKDYLFLFTAYNDYAPGTGAGYIQISVGTDRLMRVYLGSTVVLNLSALPTDGEWHFYGVVWNYDLGTSAVRIDNTTWTTSGHAGASETLPLTDAAHAASGVGRHLEMQCRAQVPFAEVQLETGPTLYAELFTRFYPTPVLPSCNAIMRQTHQRIESIAEPVPVQGWEVLQEVAEATSSWLRCNEQDNIELVPLEYFGETAQMTPETVAISTDTNASDLLVQVDPSRTRNSITTEFAETRLDSARSAILTVTSALEIPRGTTYVTFATDIPSAEMHGALFPYDYNQFTLNIRRLTAEQIADPTLAPNEHYMSVNTAAAGDGLVIRTLEINGRVVDWDSSFVTIRFINTGGRTLWLSNNGQAPYLRILGYPIRTAAAYATDTDPGSVRQRQERSLSSSNPWVQTREVAHARNNRLLTILTQPRQEVFVEVMGNPRRRPGALVTLEDAEGTAADGNWRVLSVDHTGKGAQYTQTLQLSRVYDPFIWGVTPWGLSTWSE